MESGKVTGKLSRLAIRENQTWDYNRGVLEEPEYDIFPFLYVPRFISRVKLGTQIVALGRNARLLRS